MPSWRWKGVVAYRLYCNSISGCGLLLARGKKHLLMLHSIWKQLLLYHSRRKKIIFLYNNVFSPASQTCRAAWMRIPPASLPPPCPSSPRRRAGWCGRQSTARWGRQCEGGGRASGRGGWSRSGRTCRCRPRDTLENEEKRKKGSRIDSQSFFPFYLRRSRQVLEWWELLLLLWGGGDQFANVDFVAILPTHNFLRGGIQFL